MLSTIASSEYLEAKKSLCEQNPKFQLALDSAEWQIECANSFSECSKVPVSAEDDPPGQSPRYYATSDKTPAVPSVIVIFEPEEFRGEQKARLLDAWEAEDDEEDS